jgi:hypothetical protein
MLTSTKSVATMVRFIRMFVCRIDRPPLQVFFWSYGKAHTIVHISLSLKELTRLFTFIILASRVEHLARAFIALLFACRACQSESEEERADPMLDHESV